MSHLFQFLRVLILCSSLLSCLTVHADHENWSEWQEAKRLYDAQKFQQSLEAFQRHAKEDASYYYNLGAVYYRLGILGASLAHFEKANRMHPHEADTQYNLSLIRNTLGKSIGKEKLDPASTWAEQIADRLSLDEVRTALGLLGLIALLFWTRAYLSTRSLKKAILNPNGLLALTGFIISSGVYCIQRWADSSPPAICLQKQSIRSGPGSRYLELAQSEEGSKLRLLGPTAAASYLPLPEQIAGDPSPPGSNSETAEVWSQVRYSQDGIGWVRASSLLAL